MARFEREQERFGMQCGNGLRAAKKKEGSGHLGPSHTKASENDYGIACADEVLDARGVPVRKSNATVTCGAANCFGIVRAVNADARFVQAHPEHADEVVRAGWKIVVVLGSHAVV